ncbi:MAG: ATPase, T2SS/T4P/T4SS family [Thermoprotei archaeon]
MSCVLITVGWAGSSVVFVDDPKQVENLKGESVGEVCIVGASNVLALDSGVLRRARFPVGKRVEEYAVGPLVVEIQAEPWPSYRWRPSLDTSVINSVCSSLARLRVKVGRPAGVFRQIFEGLTSYASKALAERGVNKWVEETSMLCALSALGLTPIAPLLIDDGVEEVYLDRPGALCYLDHTKHGRLWYPYIVGGYTLLRLGLYTELSVSSALSYSSNSVKGYIQTGRLNLRVSVDTEPLAADGGSCVIRKLYHSKWTVDKLICNGTMSAEVAALLVGAARAGYSLLVCGLPRSGKTTLCNAILEHLPKEWRKLYIEDVLETGAPGAEDRVVRYSTDSGFNTDKLLEVTKSLHRSPDLVFVGELQTKQQTLAAAMLMAVGIPCIQTVHATSLEGLLDRWRNIYGIRVELRSPLLVVFMDRRGGSRVVRRVVHAKFSEHGMVSSDIYVDGAINRVKLVESGLEEAYLEGVRALAVVEQHH